MATIYSLAAECGPDRSAAEAVAKHFDGIAPVLENCDSYPCDVWVSQDEEGAWWAVCHPKGFYTGINDGDEPILTALGFAMYERLKTAPPYRFADCGMEAEHCRTYDDIDAFMVEYSGFDGFVISDEIWMRLGSPAQYVPFSIGYHWKPFVCAK